MIAEISRIDTLVSEGLARPPTAIIKCDIEGGEYDALRGAERTSANTDL